MTYVPLRPGQWRYAKFRNSKLQLHGLYSIHPGDWSITLVRKGARTWKLWVSGRGTSVVKAGSYERARRIALDTAKTMGVVPQSFEVTP